MKKDAFYFPHYSNARHDRKVKRVVKELGLEGYAIYFLLLEVLRDQSDMRYPMSDIDLLADEFCTSEPKVRTVVCNYDLFDIDEDEHFFSPKLIVILSPYLDEKKRRSEAGRLGGKAKAAKFAHQIVALPEHCHSSATDVPEHCHSSAVAKRREEKIREEIKENTHSVRVRDVREAEECNWDFKKLADYERVKEVFPKNGSCRNPEAEREFYTAMKTDGAEAIISGAAKYSAYCAKKYGPNQMCGYIMQAKNFFKHRRYRDPWDELTAALSLDSFKPTTVNSIVFDGTNPNKYDNLDIEVVQNG
jgi:hypothetical protein